MDGKRGKLLIIGFGPGSFEHITQRAREAIEECEVILGYTTYVELVRGLLREDQIVVQTGMTEEVGRAQEAVRQAEQGKVVGVISSGDAGVYGMAGLVYEVLMEKGWTEKEGIAVEVIPGISAINSCASLLGAPIMHDACTISLSDHLTPWELIAKRLEAAGQADFVIALYNPKSGRRTRQIEEAQRILLKYRSPDTPVGLVKSAYRERQSIVITDLAHMLDHEIGMLTTVIIGNNSTRLYDGKMITPRGYQRKYTLNADKQTLAPHQRLRPENEPWALHSVFAGEQEQQAEKSYTRALAEEALGKLYGTAPESIPLETAGFVQESIFEFAVSPGVANKKITAQQMLVLAEIVGEKGTMEYTPHHQIRVSVPTVKPEEITAKLRAAGLLVQPVGDVVTLKACDFCDGEKRDAIPYAEQIDELFGGMQVPKELKIGFNGCGMACYGAVTEDIGLVFRKGKFDLFLGAKTTGRNAHVGQPVAEGIEPEEVVGLIERILRKYKEEGHPNERFHKFFKRVKEIEGFKHEDAPVRVLVEAVCGD
ncbi:precorrin-3B C(17)-methyltransferase [Aneurinibacillus thermoaerophilus]|uniref:precorrin-3B C(17)-methyltransferase n=1 Tax=Aneurinibacillus thermoaerophilus TaxID=143495 RepID=UPI002E21780F|nr:precorrin-3B C(17)-methyltransferase [Aneurinibacillus thermoaerophilus]MED0736647.1 precorrin-3B C(17)-methyltransferase [Aneurinibacillus thermoaerophilus]